MKRFIAIITLCFLAVVAFAQAPPTRKFLLLDTGSKDSYAVLDQPIGKLSNIFGTTRSATVGAFAGTNNFGVAVGGFSLTSSYKFATEGSLLFGVGFITPVGSRPRVAPLVGLQLSF